MSTDEKTIIQDKPTILLVDDIPENLELLISFLSQSFNTPVARNGIKAIQLAEILKPDLVLLDIQMPEMDGIETCKKLKQIDSVKDTPVIFMTALTDTQDKLKGFEAGGVDYITKPVNSAELIARINTHLTLNNMREELKKKNEILKKNALLQKRVEQITRHDLKSPLQAILWIPDMIRGYDTINDKAIHLLESVKDSALKMLNMINSSLDLYKMENGTYEIKGSSINIIKGIYSIIHTYEASFPSLTFEFTLNGKSAVSDDSCTVWGEELLLYSLFSNLIKNAVEAAPENSTITILITESEYVSVQITNEGSVPEEIRDIFFDEFTTAGKKFGTGLGTYSARLIVETLKGEISLDCSVPNQTILYVKLSVKETS